MTAKRFYELGREYGVKSYALLIAYQRLTSSDRIVGLNSTLSAEEFASFGGYLAELLRAGLIDGTLPAKTVGHRLLTYDELLSLADALADAQPNPLEGKKQVQLAFRFRAIQEYRGRLPATEPTPPGGTMADSGRTWTTISADLVANTRALHDSTIFQVPTMPTDLDPERQNQEWWQRRSPLNEVRQRAARPRRHSSPPAEQAANSVGNYRIERQLGHGGMGEVFLARDVAGEVVALKVMKQGLPGDEGHVARFRREALALQRLPAGRHLPRFIEFGANDTQQFIAMEYIAGATLKTVSPLLGYEMIKLCTGLAQALATVHRFELIHRDIKPTNIVWSATAGPTLVDFGLAHAVDATALTRTGALIGSSGFMAPERYAYAIDTPALDVWGWAAVVAFAASGRSAFGTDDHHSIERRVIAGATDPSVLASVETVNSGLAELVRRCLNTDPRARPRDGSALVGELHRLGFVARN